MEKQPAVKTNGAYPHGLYAPLDPRMLFFLSMLRRAILMVAAALEQIIEHES